MTVSNLGLTGGYSELFKRIDVDFTAGMMDVQRMERTWRTFFPAESYVTNVNYTASGYTVKRRDYTGSTTAATLGHSKDLPQVGFKVTEEFIPIYRQNFLVMFTQDEIDHYDFIMRNSQNDGQLMNLMSENIRSYMQIFEEHMDSFFYFGSTGRTKGLLANDKIETIAVDAVPAEITKSVEFFTWVVSKVSGDTMGVVKPDTVWVSQKYFSFLQRYYESSDLANLDKLSRSIATIDGRGNPVYFKIRILDMLDQTITNTLPYGEAYFMASNSSFYKFAYNPVNLSRFIESKPELYEAKGKFAFSDPYIAERGAITRVQIPATIDTVAAGE